MRRLLLILSASVIVTAWSLVIVPAGQVTEEPPLPPFVRSLPVTATPAPAVSPSRTSPRRPAVRPAPRVPTQLLLWHYRARVVPLAMDGRSLTPPPNPRTLGWWGQPAGAAQGTTLLTGHTVHRGGAMLQDLDAIPLGIVGTLSGVKYRVVRVEVVHKSDLPKYAQRMFRQDGPPQLVIVTCTNYDPAIHHHTDNVVVTLLPVV